MVQRRRTDIRSYLGADTQVPRRPRDQGDRLPPVPDDTEPSSTTCWPTSADRSRTPPEPDSSNGSAGGQRSRCCAPWPPPQPLLRRPFPPVPPASKPSPRRADTADALGAAEILDQIEDDSLDSADATPGASRSEDDADDASPRKSNCASVPQAAQPNSPTDPKRRQTRTPHQAGEGPPQGRLRPDRVRPLHPHRPLRRRAPAIRAEEHPRRGRHRRTAQRGTRRPRGRT